MVEFRLGEKRAGQLENLVGPDISQNDVAAIVVNSVACPRPPIGKPNLLFAQFQIGSELAVNHMAG